MRTLIMFTNILILSLGCASVRQSTGETRESFTVIPCETPPFVQGDPVSNAELAADIAEYVLTRKGFDCRSLARRISFCEGIYTVVFLAEGRLENTYTVDIDADTSEILSLKIRRKILAVNTR